MTTRDHDPSCLVTHLESYMALSDGELSLLADLERSEATFECDQPVQTRGVPARYLYVVKHGWLYSSFDHQDGRRHILQIHHPGDLIGIQNAPFEEATCDIVAAEDCVLCPFERRELGRVMDEQPRLGALLIAVSARDQLVAYDMKRGTTRYDAAERVLLLLLVLLHRLRVTNERLDDTMRLPLNQFQIGDTLGLTNVTVSKAFSELEHDGWLSRQSQTVTLRRLGEASAWLDFENRYAEIDTSWFPRAGAATTSA